MGLLDTPWLDGEAGAPPDDSSFTKGFRSGVTGAHGQLRALAGGVAEAVGAGDVARSEYARSSELADQAHHEAPPVSSYNDVSSLRSGYDYVTGKIGGAIPAIGAALGAAALTRGRAPLRAATAATAPMEAGAALQTAQNDPVALSKSPVDRLATAAATGTASAAVQNVLPLHMAGKVAGHVGAEAGKQTVKTVLAKNAMEGVAGQAVAGDVAENIRQAGETALNPNRDKSGDWERTKEAAIGGAAVGAPFAAVGAAGDLAHGRAHEAGTTVGDVAKGTAESFKGLFKRGEDPARAIAQDNLLSPVPEGKDPTAHIAESDANATEWARGKINEWLTDSTMAPEIKAKAQDLLTKIADPAARAEVATMALGREAVQQVKGLYTRLAPKDEAAPAAVEPPEIARMRDVLGSVESGGTPLSAPLLNGMLRDVGLETKKNETPQQIVERMKAAVARHDESVKKSEDYSGVRAVIAKELVPAVQAARPELLQSEEGMALLADSVRLLVKKAEKGERPDTKAMASLRLMLGDDMVPTLERVFNAVKGDDAHARENMYATLSAMYDGNKAHDDLANVVVDNATDKNLKPGDVRSAIDGLRSFADGSMFKGRGAEETAYVQRAFRTEMEHAFGKNTDKVLEAFQKDFEVNKPKETLDERHDVSNRHGMDNVNSDGDAAGGLRSASAHGLSESDLAFETPRFYSGKDGALVPSHEAHARDRGNQDSQARRLLEQAKKENPDRNVSFMSAKDYAREKNFDDATLHALTGGKPKDFGVVVAEGMKQEGRMTEDQARAMRLETGAHARSDARINTDKPGVTLDAYKMTQHGNKVLPRIEGEHEMRRIARSFAEGLGATLEHYGATAEKLDPNLLLAVRNGEKITLADVKKAKFKDPNTDTKDVASDIKDTERLLAKAKEAGDKDKTFDLKTKLSELKAKEEYIASVGERDRVTGVEALKNDMGIYEIDPKAEIHLAAAEHEGKMTVKADEPSVNRPAQDKPARVSKEPEPKATATAKEDTTHVPEREATHANMAADIVQGGAAAEPAMAKVLKLYPIQQRLVIRAINDHKIANRRELRNANEAVDRINTALGETLKKSPDAAYSLQLTDAAREASDKTRASVEKYVSDVLGGKVSVEWTKIMHAGEFSAAEQVIRVSVHSLDPMSTAYHESLHAFFKALRDSGNQEVMKVLYRAADAAPVMSQLRKLLKNEPEALKQIDGNREERVAYMYQFYTKEMLTLGPDARNVMGRLKDFVMKVLGLWTNDERAMKIMDYFGEGEFAKDMGDRNAVSRALLEAGTNKGIEAAKKALEPLRRLEQIVLGTGAERMRDTDIPALSRIADLISPEKTGHADDPGFIQSSLNERTARLNALVKELKGVTESDLQQAHERLRRGEKAGATPGEQQAMDAVRKFLDSAYDYMKAAGVRVRDLGYKNDYFPRVWDAEFISKHQDEFRSMIEKYKIDGKFDGDVEKVMSNLMSRDGSELGVVVDMPGMQHTKERKLSFISNEDAAPFMQKNVFYTLNSYMTQAARRAEWARRFNDDGSGMRDLLAEARKDGATQEEINMAQDYIRGIDGTLGDDINPTARRLIGNMIVYQNIRLLPLAIFSSLIDPGGIVVRGGTVKDAFKAFKRGISEIPRGFKKDKGGDEWYALAQDMGTIDDTTLVHALGSAFTQGMVSEGARKWNDAFFRFNLMEQFNTSMRVSATEAATHFIMKHADHTYSEHSKRWMGELGLTPADVKVKDGRLLTRESEGLTPEQSNKMRGAINRWVDGAILRPNAADKPIWMNDPFYALVAHLKQFTYAFQNTILKRAWSEAEYGNYAPAMALASYVPMMIAADLVKGMIQGGGNQPDWKKGWGFDDYVRSGVERAGLLGVGQFSTDLMRDIQRGGVGSVVLGPTFEQGADMVKTLAGKEMFSTLALDALPANALYKTAVREGPPLERPVR